MGKISFQSQFGFETKVRCTGIRIPHHVAAVVAFAKEDDFDSEIVSVAREISQMNKKGIIFGTRKLDGEVKLYKLTDTVVKMGSEGSATRIPCLYLCPRVRSL